MTDRPDPRAIDPLSIETDLTIGLDGIEADVDSTGERLLVQFRSVPDALQALRQAPDGEQDRLAALLTAMDLTAELRVRNRIVAVAGADARPNALSGLVGVDPIEVRIGGALGAVCAEAGAIIARRADR